MLKKLVPVVAATALTVAAVPSARAFDVGGANGWKFSTDGIVDVFATYETAQGMPGGNRSVSLINLDTNHNQRFDVMVGLLPSVVGLNIAAPTTNGIDSKVRVGIYPSIQNKTAAGALPNRFDVNPNIDFREIFYTAKGSFGEVLAGRALNLYQGKNILTDMTLLGVGVVPVPGTSTTLGHIGYGYLYTNFGPQLRYTTPDLSGIKVAVSVNEPYNINIDTGKTPTPRVETEISYAATLGGGNTLQAWASGIYQSATRKKGIAVRPGGEDHSLGGALGVETAFGNLDLLASGYYGEGLGMVSVQDGSAAEALFGSSAIDAAGKERTQWGFLAQATYKLTPSLKVGANYGVTAQDKTSADRTGNLPVTGIPMRKTEAGTLMVAYNFNSFTQLVTEYTWAQNTWQDDRKQHSNSVSLGTMFYW